MIPTGEPAEEEGDGTAPSLGVEVGRVPGLVRRGVIYGLWDPPEGYDPFCQQDWFRKPGEQEGEPWQPTFRAPVFAVVAGGKWGFGAAPGHRADRVAFQVGADRPTVVLGNDGRLRLVSSATALAKLGPTHINGVRVTRGS